ncbi:hypothetical protein MASR2M74_20410 [Paracoccaceae bacterium]
MTLIESNLEPSRWLLSLQQILSTFLRQRRTMSAIAHLDDRLRIDVGLPPTGERPLLPHEAAARAAMLAWR